LGIDCDDEFDIDPVVLDALSFPAAAATETLDNNNMPATTRREVCEDIRTSNYEVTLIRTKQYKPRCSISTCGELLKIVHLQYRNDD
jgi:hypothetical protein